MKIKHPILLGLLLTHLCPSAFAQGTAFTYQGRLDESFGPANGSYDLTFRLFDAVSGGSGQGGPLTNSAVSVSDGYFNVTLDFGLNPFSSGAARWVEIAVRTNGGGAFGLLTPRQALTPAPYAIYSGNVSGAGISGTISSSSIANGSIGSNQLNDGAALAELLDDDGAGSGLDADLLDGLQASAFWQLGGNGGTIPSTHFLGTTDNQPLEIKVNDLRALRLEPHATSPNVIGGFNGNFVSPGFFGSTIGGGGFPNFSNAIFASFATIAGGAANDIGSIADYSAIGGGGGNNIAANSYSATIAGGLLNNIGTDCDFSTIGGGYINYIAANAQYATIVGGGYNAIGTNATYSTLGGGFFNSIATNAIYATIPGGLANAATNYAFAAGRRAKAHHTGAFVWADSQDADFASTVANQFLIRASGGVGIGETAPEARLHVSEGSAGTMTANANSVAVFEKSGNGYISILTPTASESGILFASPTNAADGGIVYNSDAERGLDFRTAGNLTKMVLTAAGNVGIGISNPTNKLHVAGGITCTALVETSDRNAKENFEPVSPRAVLDKVATLPITTWSFKGLHDGRHMGPMAQDFYAAFGLGSGDTTIASIDRDGVALAAIQGLHQKVDDSYQRSEARSQTTESRIRALEAENAGLRQRLEKLENLLARQK